MALGQWPRDLTAALEAPEEVIPLCQEKWSALRRWFCVLFPHPADVFWRKIWQLLDTVFCHPRNAVSPWRAFWMAPHPGMPGVHRGRCQRRISSHFLCNDVTCRYFWSSKFLGDFGRNVWSFSGVAAIFAKRLLGPGNRKKRNKQLFQKNPKTVIRSIYFHIKFGGKKRQHNNGVSGIDGKDGSLFLFCPKNSFFVLPIRESPPAMKLPAQVTMEISSYVSETCPKGLPTFSF